MPESVVNRALAVVAEGMRERITSLSVRIDGGDRFCNVDLDLAQRFVPPIAIQVLIERQPDLPASPELVLRVAHARAWPRRTGPSRLLRF